MKLAINKFNDFLILKINLIQDPKLSLWLIDKNSITSS